MMVSSIVGMSIFRHLPISDIVNQLDIMLPGKRPFVAPSAIVQTRQRLGADVVKRVFEQTKMLWHEKTPSPSFCELKLLGVDGLFGVLLTQKKMKLPLGSYITISDNQLTLKSEWFAK